MRDTMAAAEGKSTAVIVRHLFEPISDGARIQGKTVTKGRLNYDKANTGRQVRLDCAAAEHFMRTRLWEAFVTKCLEEGGTNNKRVGGRLWGDVCREWWDNFAKTCVYAWQTSWLSGGGGIQRLRAYSIRLDKAHLMLQWPRLLCSHVSIDHMYFFVR